MNDLNITPETLLPLVQAALVGVVVVAAVASIVAAISSYRAAKKALAKTVPGTEEQVRAEALSKQLRNRIGFSGAAAVIGVIAVVLIVLYLPALLSTTTPL